MTRSRFRWVVIALIFFITVTNYVDRNAISFAIGDMGQQLGFAAGDKGLVLGAFGIGYAITVFFGGIWADHYGAHRTLAAACLVWSLAIGMTGLAAGFGMLVAARVGLGLAEGPNFPALNRTVADWLSSRELVPIALRRRGYPVCGKKLLETRVRYLDFRGKLAHWR